MGQHKQRQPGSPERQARRFIQHKSIANTRLYWFSADL
jgi:hypothetical protein